MRKICVFAGLSNSTAASSRIFKNIFDSVKKIGFDFFYVEKLLDIDLINDGDIVIGTRTDNFFLKYCKINKKETINILYLCDLEHPEFLIKNDFLYHGYAVPTKFFKGLIDFFVKKKVFILNELIDPLYWNSENEFKKERYSSLNFCWYGYSQSYNKSMFFYEKTIEEKIKLGDIEKFSIISDVKKLVKNDFFYYINYSDENIKKELMNFGYCILSHAPFDLHINTFFKSPNKLISAISCGLIPICSKTPSYIEVMNEFGYDDFLISSPNDLDIILCNFKKNIEINVERAVVAKKQLLNYFEKNNVINKNVLEQMLYFDFSKIDIVTDKDYSWNVYEDVSFRDLMQILIKKITRKIM